ncbi:MAG: hypothetical protein IPF69_11515 [Chitinophagaceae bacterium]|nr:hypothetical protein [Chitinophagaceae bacterium]MBK7679610.1 hypothetical protein [Chitinophagaceae bacterium]MBK8299037.1 hypothetical protein [Chitinophagaceae bacterium]MBK9464858.1 hypothetical protein [Chitinophagaceae bacterium]MBK9659781.1 hypothetical protein [Chitinophagaceae bacterium]
MFKFFRGNKENKSGIILDNNSDLNYEEAISFIKKTFIEKVANSYSYKQNQYSDPHGYWGITFSKENISIFLGSERSSIDYRLTINGNNIYLGSFDDRVLQLKNTSKKNFIFLIDLILRYLAQYPIV